MSEEEETSSASGGREEERCAHCGERIVYRKAMGAYMHASASVAACDLDSDHAPTPVKSGAEQQDR